MAADGEATNIPPANIGKAAGRGLRWSLASTVGTKVITFSMGLVLARLLTPADFGTFAIASAATLLVMHINDAGLIAAVVQWRGKLEEVASTATTLAALFSVVIYGAFWLLAPAFSRLAGDPAAAPVVRLLTIIILIDGITAVRSAALMRHFQQDRLTVANLVGIVAFAGSAIALALTGAGAYSFAAGQVIGNAITGVIVLILAKVPFGVRVDRQVAAQLMRFGVPLAASLGVEAILTNADYVIVGRLLGVVALGYYLLAFNISGWMQGMIGTAIRYVSIAAFSRLSDRDTEELSRGVQRSIPVLISVLLPVVVLMTTLAPQVVAVLYGDKWLPAVTALRFLMVLAGVRLLTGIALDILTGAGATRSSLWVNIGWAAALIPALVIGTRLDGIRGTAMAHALIGVFVAVPLAIVALHYAGVRMGEIPHRLIRPAIAGVACTACTVAVAHAVGPYPVVQLAVAGTLGLACYALICVPGPQRRAFTARAQERVLPVWQRLHQPATIIRIGSPPGQATARLNEASPATVQLATANGAHLANGAPATVEFAFANGVRPEDAGPETLQFDAFTDTVVFPAPISPAVGGRVVFSPMSRWPTYIGSAPVRTVYAIRTVYVGPAPPEADEPD
ncbi:MAG TPA: lipopolysaccharide biosynthesis protein [Micromonosporaceae bacterium]|jgi:PST family polysaccharide transporter|nr:lipopolysaccharide biosynthesis protein [Micromonosporaceae bacterium]